MSLYEFSNSVNNFSGLVSGSEGISAADLKDKTSGELFLSLGVPAGYTVAKKFGSRAIKSIRARMRGEAEEEEAPVEEDAIEMQEFGVRPGAQQQMMDADEEDVGLGVEGTEAATTEGVAEAGVEAGAILEEGGEIAAEASVALGPEAGLAIGAATLVASAVMGVIDLFKHHHEQHIVANLPQIGV